MSASQVTHALDSPVLSCFVHHSQKEAVIPLCVCIPSSLPLASQRACPAAGLCKPLHVQVDDLLEAHGVQLLGKDGASAVILQHAGFQLFPLQEDALPPPCHGSMEVQTAAALVPLALVPEGSSSEED